MQVRIERSGNLCSINPWIPSLVRELSFTRIEKIDTTKMSHEERRKVKKPFKDIVEKLYTVRDNVGYFTGGVLHRVLTHLNVKGITYDYVDHRDLARLMPEPNFAAVEPLRADQPETLIKLATQNCGVIVCNTGWGKSFLIKQICLMYPTLKIVIIAPGSDEITNVYDRLTPAFPHGTVGLIGAGQKHSSDRRIVCTTTKSMMHADLQQCDLILFDEVHAVGWNQVADALRWVGDARMFGFTASPEGRSDQSEMIREAYFGPVIAEFEYEDSVQKGTASPIEVHLYEVRGVATGKKVPHAKKRAAYWRNNIRNLMISYLATTVPEDEQVLIIVETVEHGMYLKRLLPDFTFVYGNLDHADYVNYVHQGFIKDPELKRKDRDEFKKQFAEGTLKRVIATGVWKQAVNFPKLSVLIRAEGAASIIESTQIPGRLSRIADGKEKGILIDFIDGFDGWAASRARKRINLYRKKKWQIIRKGGVNV